ncbi:D-amino acid dehydrogenase [Gammaproteobacteria bacterium]|nr:D-amino acid dehydrogenase [Gammaproteobacteria bacterium]MDA8928646.1 D-amino acid dehydrogenase [Gammaproteobacteria bacterium]MDA9054214.1 D-amino acid dehydrogenase [Gammaproteobacteria bacterium]MDB4835811.1 D-amino acid dehydrogenase [Gammaproteobacteria bacterium]MDC0005277.1 D-amino acid dehydrogenase [Gammaproteobacteria bacterium]
MKKVAVIGAGIAGTTTAYALLKKGYKVTIIDSRRYPAMATSYANGGQLSASNAETWNTPKNVMNGIKWMFKPDAPLLFNPSPEIQKYKWMMGFLWATLKGEHKKNTLETIDMAKKAREIYFKIAEDEGIEFELLKKGILRFYDSEKEFKLDQAKKSWLDQEGMEWDTLTTEEVKELEPAFKNNANYEKIVGGIYTKSDASGDIHKFCTNLERVLVEKYSASLQLNTTVEYISRQKGELVLTMRKENEIMNDSFDNVVICAGVGTQSFASRLGDKMNIYPVKGYSITIDLKDELSKSCAPSVSLIDQPVKIVASRLGNRFRVAGTAELAGINTDIRQNRIRPLLDWVEKYFPNVSTETYTPWAGLRPMTPNMMPITSESRMKGVFYHAGHGHLGWTLSAETANQVVAKIEAES